MKKNEEVNVDYWVNGNKKVETHFKNGKPEGLITIFYESDVKGVEGHCKNGKKEGLQTAWYESGEKEHEIFFQEVEGTKF